MGKRQAKARLEQDFKYDHPFYYSKRSGIRYLKDDAMIIIELRMWSESNSSYLNDLDNAQWRMKETEDNKLSEW